MAKYQVNFTCGHTETVQLFGKHTERERWIEWAERNKVCPECYEKQKEETRQEATKQAAAEAIENGLPSLTGSEKQIAWAERIRVEKISKIEESLAQLDSNQKKIEEAGKLSEAEAKVKADGFESLADFRDCIHAAANDIMGTASAHFWIEIRGTKMGQFLIETAKEILKSRKDTIPAALDAKAEATIRPESPLTETVAEIRVHEKSVEVVFPEKREDFWQIIKKELGYIWSGTAWNLPIGIKTGSAADRAAEAGNRLMSAGFIVRIFDPAIREAAIYATYETKCDRWITRSGTDNSRFLISWGDRDERIYNASRKIKGSKYSSESKAVTVPPEQFEEVLDFAAMYEFRLSPGAQEIVDKARTAREAAMIAKPVQPEPERLPIPGDKPRKLAVPEDVEVADEFKD